MFYKFFWQTSLILGTFLTAQSATNLGNISCIGMDNPRRAIAVRLECDGYVAYVKGEVVTESIVVSYTTQPSSQRLSVPELKTLKIPVKLPLADVPFRLNALLKHDKIKEALIGKGVKIEQVFEAGVQSVQLPRDTESYSDYGFIDSESPDEVEKIKSSFEELSYWDLNFPKFEQAKPIHLATWGHYCHAEFRDDNYELGGKSWCKFEEVFCEYNDSERETEVEYNGEIFCPQIKGKCPATASQCLVFANMPTDSIKDGLKYIDDQELMKLQTEPLQNRKQFWEKIRKNGQGQERAE